MCGNQDSNTPSPRHSVILFTRPDCHLCDRAKAVIESCRAQAAFEIEVVDISHKPELIESFGNDIPVVLLDGIEIARHFVRERKLLELLR